MCDACLHILFKTTIVHFFASVKLSYNLASFRAKYLVKLYEVFKSLQAKLLE